MSKQDGDDGLSRMDPRFKSKLGDEYKAARHRTLVKAQLDPQIRRIHEQSIALLERVGLTLDPDEARRSLDDGLKRATSFRGLDEDEEGPAVTPELLTMVERDMWSGVELSANLDLWETDLSLTQKSLYTLLQDVVVPRLRELDEGTEAAEVRVWKFLRSDSFVIRLKLTSEEVDLDHSKILIISQVWFWMGKPNRSGSNPI